MCGTEIEARRALEAVIRAAGRHGDGWWVLNTIPLRGRERNSDADVVVGIPNSGLLILEVKGWTRFTVDDQGIWSRPGAAGRPVTSDGPFAQAQRQEYLLYEMLQDCRNDGLMGPGSLPRIGSGVVFGNLMAAEVDAADWANDLRFTLFRDTFCPSADPSEDEAVQILNRVRALLGANTIPDRQTDNSAPRLGQVERLLAPTRKVSGLAAFVADSHEGLNQLAEAAMSAKADVLTANSLYVEGAAGTGKTVLALQLGLQRSRSAKRPSLYICYSPRLAEEIRGVRQDGDGAVLIFTPEELLRSLAGVEAMDPFLRAEAEAAKAALEVAELMGTNAEPEQSRAYLGSGEFWDTLVTAVAGSRDEYAAVVVDEAQDLWEPAFAYLSSLVGPNDLFAVFVDPHQTTRRERAGLVWAQPVSTVGGHAIRLNRNFRNGDRIIDAVEQRFRIGYDRPPRGPLPAELMLQPYSNQDPLPGVVIRHEAELRDAGLDPVVLTTGVSVEQEAALKAHGITPNTVESFKGLERKAVILVLGSDTSPVDPNDEDLYVGMTRATVLLSLVFHASRAPLSSGV
jgi:hypothetical protein